jgi:hypothetical protein
MTKKDTRLTLRISSEVKGQLEDIAAKEGRSAAQITEAFIRLGIRQYELKGSTPLKPFLASDNRSTNPTRS